MRESPHRLFPASGRSSGRVLHHTSGIQALSKRPSGHLITTLELTKGLLDRPEPAPRPLRPKGAPLSVYSSLLTIATFSKLIKGPLPSAAQ